MHFTAIDLITSEIRWEVACAQDASRFERSQRQTIAGSSTLIVAEDYAYFDHDDTSIRTVNNQIHLVWTYRLGTPIKIAPVVCGNLLFAHDYSGNLWCFAPTI
ncbi:MAG: PQQ-binding-like beta-propeller repeat protein [Candidatus Poribacteria bacterium]|nr:PQQ-binding-like beta-propeller repeat protein [Candidatus Poribacteria bacterium]